jgi:hypothetical protein
MKLFGKPMPFRKSRLALLGLMAMTLALLGASCDPEVEAIVLGGLNDLTNTLVDAFFTAIAANDQSTTLPAS